MKSLSKTIVGFVSLTVGILSPWQISEGAIFTWNGSSTSPSGTGSALTISDISRVGGANQSLIDISSPSPGSGGNNYQANVSLGNSTYFQITVTPSSGYAVELISLSFYSRSTTTGPADISLFSSLDDFSSAIGSFSGQNNNSWVLRTINGQGLLGGLGESVTFRISGSSASSTGTVANWRLDDISFNLTAVPVPEPTQVALGVFGAMISVGGIVRWQKKRSVANR